MLSPTRRSAEKLGNTVRRADSASFSTRVTERFTNTMRRFSSAIIVALEALSRAWRRRRFSAASARSCSICVRNLSRMWAKRAIRLVESPGATGIGASRRPAAISPEAAAAMAGSPPTVRSSTRVVHHTSEASTRSPPASMPPICQTALFRAAVAVSAAAVAAPSMAPLVASMLEANAS